MSLRIGRPAGMPITGIILGFCILLPFLISVSVYVPVYWHYRTPEAQFSSQQVSSIVASLSERRGTLERLASYPVMGVFRRFDHAALIAEADVLASRCSDGSGPCEIAGLGGGSAEGEASVALSLDEAALADVAVLLDAFWKSGEESYLIAAERGVREFVEIERGTLFPKGLIWNDHAMVLRITVFARLLAAMGENGRIDYPTSKKIIRAMDHAVWLLGRDSHFAFRSNHGLMQNMGVLYAATFAPQLPSAQALLDRSMLRAQRHLEYLISPHGVFREHSSGYQFYDLGLMALTFRLLELLGRSIPESWVDRYEKGLQYFAHIRRPDGSIPRHGDTNGRADRLLVADVSQARNSVVISESSEFTRETDVWFSASDGYWSEWRNDSHLLVAWPNFPSRAHKHADDLAVYFWSKGQEFWTGSGYWPYGDERRREAIGWASSNGPHYVGERARGNWRTSVAGHVADGDLSVLQLRRCRDDGRSLERIIAWLPDSALLVVDIATNPREDLEVLWRMMPDVALPTPVDINAPDRVIRLKSRQHGHELVAKPILTSDGTMRAVFRSADTTKGWVALNGQIVGAPALELRSGKSNLVGMYWRTSSASLDSENLAPERVDVTWNDPENWQVQIIDQAGKSETRLVREQASIRLEESGSLAALHSFPAVEPSDALLQAERAYLSAAEQYDTFRVYSEYRWKVFSLGLLASGLQALILILLVPWLRRQSSLSRKLLLTGICGHSCLGAWIHLVYLAP